MYNFRQYVEYRDQQLDEINLKQAMAGLGLGLSGMFGANAADISNPKAIPTLPAQMNQIAQAEAGEDMPSYGVFTDRGKDVHRYIKNGKLTQTGYYPKEAARNLQRLQQKDPTWYYDTHYNILRNPNGETADPHSGKPLQDFSSMSGIKLKPTSLPKPQQVGPDGKIVPVAKPMSANDAQKIIDRELSGRIETGEPPLAR